MFKLLLCIVLTLVGQYEVNASASNVKLLTVLELKNLGVTQDSKECGVSADDTDEITLIYKTAGRDYTVLDNIQFKAWSTKTVEGGSKFLCVNTGEFLVRELDGVSYHDEGIGNVDCTYAEGEYYVEVELVGSSCLFAETKMKYRIMFKMESFPQGPAVQVKSLFNINRPSEFTLDSSIDPTSGDELILRAQFDEIGAALDIPWENSYWSFMKSKRNSIITFPNLILPCTGTAF